MPTYQREFINHIPDTIFFDQEMTLTDIRVYGVIRSFIDSQKEMYASNNWMAEKIGVHRTTIIDSLKKLVNKGYVRKEIINNTDRRLYIGSPIIFTSSENTTSSLNPTPSSVETTPPRSVYTTPPSSVETTQIDQSINISNLSSLSNIIDNPRAREEEKKEDFSDKNIHLPKTTEWDDIDIRSLECIGFTREKIIQIKEYGKLTVSQVRTSIINLTIALSSGHKMQNPLAYFMTMMRNGDMFIYEKSIDDKNASNNSKKYDMANQCFEELKRKREEIKREYERRNKLGLYDAFDKWYAELDELQKEKLAPMNKNGNCIPAQRIALRILFFKTIKEEENAAKASQNEQKAA